MAYNINRRSRRVWTFEKEKREDGTALVTSAGEERSPKLAILYRTKAQPFQLQLLERVAKLDKVLDNTGECRVLMQDGQALEAIPLTPRLQKIKEGILRRQEQKGKV